MHFKTSGVTCCLKRIRIVEGQFLELYAQFKKLAVSDVSAGPRQRLLTDILKTLPFFGDDLVNANQVNTKFSLDRTTETALAINLIGRLFKRGNHQTWAYRTETATRCS